MKKLITQLNGLKFIRTTETKDVQATGGLRKRQWKLQILKDAKSVKCMYFLDKSDRNSAYRGFMKLLEVL